MEQDKIWDYYQNEAIDTFDGSYGRLSFLVDSMQPGERVLNIGVGGGILEKMALVKGVDIFSLDPSQSSIENLRNKVGEERAKVGYSQNIPFESESFDRVVMSEVLEHLDDDTLEATVDEVRRVLKKGGLFVGTVPYDENLEEQTVVCPKCAEVFHRWGHVQSFDETRMTGLLKKHFVDVTVSPKMFISWNVLNWKGKIATSLLYLLYLVRVKRSGLNLYFQGRRG